MTSRLVQESREMLRKSIAGLCLAGVLALCGTMPPAPLPLQAAAAAPYRWYSHIFVFMLENHAPDVLASKYAPRLAALSRTYGLAIHYYAITHPSGAELRGAARGQHFRSHR